MALFGPEAGKRKRKVRGAVQQMMKAFPGWEVDSGGTLRHGGKEICRYDADKETSVRRQGSQAFFQEMGIDWEAVNKSCAEAEQGA